jgi:hypothetical protein
MYGVSEKTTRDIWMGRTWKAETRHVDPLLPLEVRHADRAYDLEPTQGKTRECHPARAKDQPMVSNEDAGWPLTESLKAESCDNREPGFPRACFVRNRIRQAEGKSID